MYITKDYFADFNMKAHEEPDEEIHQVVYRTFWED